MIREVHTSDREQILKFTYAMWQEAEGWVPADLSTKADINAICRFDICLEIQKKFFLLQRTAALPLWNARGWAEMAR